MPDSVSILAACGKLKRGRSRQIKFGKLTVKFVRCPYGCDTQLDTHWHLDAHLLEAHPEYMANIVHKLGF